MRARKNNYYWTLGDQCTILLHYARMTNDASGNYCNDNARMQFVRGAVSAFLNIFLFFVKMCLSLC
jgi:hypothetical protein